MLDQVTLRLLDLCSCFHVACLLSCKLLVLLDSVWDLTAWVLYSLNANTLSTCLHQLAVSGYCVM